MRGRAPSDLQRLNLCPAGACSGDDRTERIHCGRHSFFGMLKKIDGEEAVIESHFSDYAQYKLRVKKLIPFVH